MENRRILTILGWIVAAILLILYLGSQYEISFHKKSILMFARQVSGQIEVRYVR